MDASTPIKQTMTLGNRYPRQIALLRVGIGTWLIVLTVILHKAGHIGPWAWLLLAVAGLHFVLALRLVRIARRRPGGTQRPSLHGLPLRPIDGG